MLREPPGRASSVIFLQIWFWAYVIVVAVGQGSKSSHVAYNRSSIPNPFRDDEPACDLQVYSFASWHAENGDELPDHPAIFEPDPGTSFPALKMFPSFESVLLKMGQDKVNSEPGYAQAGGHLEIVWPGSKVRAGILEAVQIRIIIIFKSLNNHIVFKSCFSWSGWLERFACRAFFKLELLSPRMVSLRIQLPVKLMPQIETFYGASCALWTRFKRSQDQFLGRRAWVWSAIPSPFGDLANISQRSESVVFGAT